MTTNQLINMPRMTRSRAKLLCKESDSKNIIGIKSENEFIRKNHSQSLKRRLQVTERVDSSHHTIKKRKVDENQNIVTKTDRLKKETQPLNLMEQSDIIKTEETRKLKKFTKADDNLRKTADFETNGAIPKNVNMPNEKCNQIATLEFKEGDVIWAKNRGFPNWPARIESIYGEKRQLYRIYWFNDYRVSKVFKSQITNFCKNFDENSRLFDSHLGLETAAREALIYLGSKEINK